MTQIEKIKAEIKRLYEKYRDAFHQFKDDYHLGLYDGLDMTTRVIDSLPEEQPSEDLEEEIDSYWNRKTGFQPPFAILELKKKDLAEVARHFADWGAEHPKE